MYEIDTIRNLHLAEECCRYEVRCVCYALFCYCRLVFHSFKWIWFLVMPFYVRTDNTIRNVFVRKTRMCACVFVSTHMQHSHAFAFLFGYQKKFVLFCFLFHFFGITGQLYFESLRSISHYNCVLLRIMFGFFISMNTVNKW